MKWNKTTLVLASVSVAAAAAAAYLLTTDNGRKLTRSLGRRGKEVLNDIAGLSQQAKEKLREMEGVFNSYCTDEKTQATSVKETANS